MRKVFVAALLLAGVATPAAAQSASEINGRLSKVEKELRAVQRKVFPGANPEFFDAEIAPKATPAPTTGTPATAPIADLTARVDTIERELARLTGEVEQTGFRTRQLEDAFNRYRTATDARIDALAAGPVVAEAETPALAAATSEPRPAPAATRAPALPPAPAPATTRPEPAPAPAPAAAPATGDAGEDAYMAGYRLWEAKRYGEAQTALKAVVAKYPKHRRASYAQNLLGRAYLDDGKPGAAAEAFYANYQKMPRGERAPDSLYFLGQSLVQLKKPADACKVYGELDDVYGATIAEPLKSRVAAGRAAAKCQD